MHGQRRNDAISNRCKENWASGMSAPVVSDVIVVGAGIMGSTAAFFLRQRGRSVTLLERGLAGQQASGVNFGNVRRQGRYLSQLPLAN